MSYIKDVDIDVYNAIVEEEKRQEEGIELIASENFVSKAVSSSFCLYLFKSSQLIYQSIIVFSTQSISGISYQTDFNVANSLINPLEIIQ